jgi:hypothetical protein
MYLGPFERGEAAANAFEALRVATRFVLDMGTTEREGLTHSNANGDYHVVIHDPMPDESGFVPQTIEFRELIACAPDPGPGERPVALEHAVPPRVSDGRVDIAIADRQAEADFVAICRVHGFPEPTPDARRRSPGPIQAPRGPRGCATRRRAGSGRPDPA